MKSPYESFEDEAFRQSGITPGKKWKNLTKTEKEAVDSYLYNNIERQSAAVKAAPQAKKYLNRANNTYEKREAAAKQEIKDGVSPGAAFANDFMDLGDGRTINTLDDDSGYLPDRNDSTRARENEREELRDDNGEEDESETNETVSNPTEPTEDEDKSSEPANEEPKGTDIGKTSKRAEGIENGAKATEAASGAVDGAAALETVGAGAAKTAVAADAGFSATGLLAVVAILVAFMLLVSAFVAISWGNPDSAKAKTPGSTPSVICIDPGHPSEVGSGTTSPSGISENSMNWLVATDLEKALKAKGYTVVKTKDSENQYVNNKDRVDKCAAAGAAFDYRIHMDSPGGIAGPWHEIPGPGYSNVHDTSKKYAEAIQDSIAKELGITAHKSGSQPVNGGVRNDTKALVGSSEANKKKLPVALIEMMTMDNANVSWLNNDTNRVKLIKGIVGGITNVIPITTNTGGNSSGSAIVDAARKYLGTKYSWGGGNYSGPSVGFGTGAGVNGFDCSGLTMYAVYQGTNKKIKLPHSSKAQSEGGSKITKANLKVGDLVFFGSPVHHVGIYTGNGNFINAPNTGSVVREEKIWSTFVWGVRYQ